MHQDKAVLTFHRPLYLEVVEGDPGREDHRAVSGAAENEKAGVPAGFFSSLPALSSPPPDR
jgi:hypothetical protein